MQETNIIPSKHASDQQELQMFTKWQNEHRVSAKGSKQSRNSVRSASSGSYTNKMSLGKKISLFSSGSSGK